MSARNMRREYSPSCGAATRAKPMGRLCEGIHIVDSPQRNPKGCQKVAGGRSPRRPPEESLVMTAPRRGARRQVNVKDLYTKDLAPLRGATQLISRIPGGLRGLRPPATFLATLRVAEVSQLYSYLRKASPWAQLGSLLRSWPSLNPSCEPANSCRDEPLCRASLAHPVSGYP